MSVVVPSPADEAVPRSLAGVFERLPVGQKIRCRSCGATGHPNTDPSYDRWWGWTHREHVACPTCGGLFTPGGGLAAHRRKHHGERGLGIGLGR